MEGKSLQYAGAERYPQGSGSDFSNVIVAINERDPDVIFLASYGPDPGNFMAQYAAAGGEALVIGPEFTAEAADAGGEAYNGMYFAQDNFLALAPANAWATQFVENYRAEYGSDPTIYSASYYDTLFLVWQLLELDGADPADGEAMQALLEANLGPYPSVVGAGDLSGSLAFDPETHAMSERGYVIGKVEDGAPVLLASYGADGSDLKKL